MFKILLSGGILIFAAAFFFIGKRAVSIPAQDMTAYHASFDTIGQLKKGADVQIAGVKVGVVKNITLDMNDFAGDVEFLMESGARPSAASEVTIASPTMTSAEVLEIRPARTGDAIRPGGVFPNTRAPVAIEQQISNYIFGAGNLGS